jgi:hypothetical protein
MLDVPPGFSLDVPPGFTKAHRQLQIKDTPVSYADAFASLVLDCPPGFPIDIPPGFTEVHRQLPAISPAGPEAGVSIHGTETKPLIRFSLNVPSSVKMEVPPGFTVHAVKKEPRLPVDKTTEKQTTSRLTSGASPLVKGAAADEMKITRDEVQSCPHPLPQPYFLTKNVSVLISNSASGVDDCPLVRIMLRFT